MTSGSEHASDEQTENEEERTVTEREGERGGLEIVESTMGPEGDIELTTDQSLLDLLFEQVEQNPDDVAIRWKQLGIWQEYTWEDYREIVEAFALGLEECGFQYGDVLFTLGYNRPHQLWSWIAAQSIGGIPAPAYKDKLPEELLVQLELVEASVAYAEDQEMVDKILAIEEDLPDLETIIYRDEKGMFRYEDRDGTEVVSFESVLEEGRRRREAASADHWRQKATGIDSREIAFMPPTGGTTGASKRPKLTHRNYINVAETQMAVDGDLSGIDYFSKTTMAWSGEQVFLTASTLLENWTVFFPEQPATEEEDMREIGPELLLSSPALFEDWVADIQARIENTTPVKRWAYEKAMVIGERYVDTTERGDEPSLLLRALYRLSYWTIYRPILDEIGLTRVKSAFTGGAPFGHEHFQFYKILTFPIKQMWGQTELGSFVTVHRSDDIRLETVGQPLPSYEVGVTPGHELVVSGPALTEGYHNQPEKTEELLEDGWLHTGDRGTVTNGGHVKMVERMGNLYELSDGSRVSPSVVESTLKFNPYIKNAMVVGDGRDHLVAILNIRFENVAEWADQHDIQYNGYKDLSQKPEVLDLLAELVEEANDQLEDEEHIHSFASLFKVFDPDDGELNRVGKLRRPTIEDKYGRLIEAMYDSSDSIDLETKITYQDGSESVERKTVLIVEVKR